jgi:peptide/nickel transport system permease protein
VTIKGSRALRRLRRHQSMLIGLAIVAGFLLLAALAGLLTTRSPLEQDLGQALRPPGPAYPMGTDFLGRDLWSRILYGARTSLGIAHAAVAFGLLAGGGLGLVAGYAGGRVDQAIMRAVDALMGFPHLLLAITFLSIVGSGLANLVIVIALYLVPEFARIARAAFLAARGHDYVEAAQALGARPRRVVLRHVLPNCFAPIVVMVTLRMGTIILEASGLSFLGLGVKPPTPEWGNILSDGRAYLRVAPHASVIPGLTISLLVLGYNFLGDGLRDLLDPARS